MFWNPKIVGTQAARVSLQSHLLCERGGCSKKSLETIAGVGEGGESNGV